MTLKANIPADQANTSSEFSEAKRIYKAKKKAKRTSDEDDIAFKRAQIKEVARIHRLERDISDSSDEEADHERSHEPMADQELFITRVNSMVDGQPDFGDISDLQADDGPHLKRKKTQPRGRRPLRELEQEIFHNWYAGFEEIQRRHRKAEEYAESDTNDEFADGEVQNSPVNEGNAPQKKKIKKPKQHQSKVLKSLTSNNVYRDAEANRGKEALPAMRGSAKKEAMKNLIASVQIADKQEHNQAVRDKNQILKASQVFGSKLVRADNSKGIDASDEEGAWKFKGISKLLMHHQLMGAARMKEQEDNPHKPQGGKYRGRFNTVTKSPMLMTMHRNTC